MSPFDAIPESSYIASNDLAFAVRDSFPVSDGHSLVITRRRVKTWFDATRKEQLAIVDLIDEVKRSLDHEFSPAGYNVGFNAGTASGQTIDHLHVHVIPRFEGDVPDPTGGIRHVIPDRANYLQPPGPRLVTPQDGEMRRALVRCLVESTYDRIDLLVAFVMQSGLNVIAEAIEMALDRGAHIRVLTTDYLAVTDPPALGFLLDRIGSQASGGRLDVRIFSDPRTSFHPKAYLFRSSANGTGTAFVGSSNLSRSALMTGIEWNLETAHFETLAEEFDGLWDDPRSTQLAASWLAAYSIRRSALADQRIEHKGELVGDEDPAPRIAPWPIQQRALDALTATRLDGHRAGLVVMATGLGKTWLAAFDSSRPGTRRVLFVAHREEILKRSRDVFRSVRPGGSLTLFVGGDRDPSGDIVFAGIQSLERNLHRFARDEFDYIIVDEFHHAAAPTYRKVIGHFTPRFLLGLTATPDRTDAADLLALCDDNLVFECGLLDGLEQGILSPFSYRAIKDIADYENIPWRSGRFVIESLTERLETRERAEQVLREWRTIGGPGRRALAFCCSVTHADFMSRFFTERGVAARAVHSGPTSADRVEALADLDSGTVEIIFSVDLFNEGIDVPALDVVLMLRPTESPIVFFQQLGRGLRKTDGKARLDVIDFVGNHRGFLMKARLLAALAGVAHCTDLEAIAVLKEPLDRLPDGCSIVVDIEVVDLLTKLAGAPSKEDRLAEFIRAWTEDHGGVRPTALEVALTTSKAIDSGRKKGGWFGVLGRLDHLSTDEQRVLEACGGVLIEIEHGSYTKAYKLVTWLALAETGRAATGAPIAEIAEICRSKIFGDPRLLNDLADAGNQFADVLNPTDREWNAYWDRNPINALCGEGRPFTRHENDLVPSYSVPEEFGATFASMVIEIAQYRLHRYLAARDSRNPAIGLHPTIEGGKPFDATFRLTDALGEPLSVIIDSAGDGRNAQYVEGLDLLLARLAELRAQLRDAYVDSRVVRRLPLEDRRLIDDESRPIELADEDLAELRKLMLRRMKDVGREPGAKGGGNARKALRLVLDGIEGCEPSDVATFLERGGPVPTGRPTTTEERAS